MLFPDCGKFLPRLVEIPVRNFLLQILFGSFSIGEGRSRFYQYLFMAFYVKAYIDSDIFFMTDFGLSREQTVFPESSEVTEVFLVVYDKVSTVSGRFSPALINAMYGIVAVNTFLKGINFDISFSFVTVRIDDEISFSFLLVGKTENGRP